MCLATLVLDILLVLHLMLQFILTFCWLPSVVISCRASWPMIDYAQSILEFLREFIFLFTVLDSGSLRAHSIMRNRFHINPDISETGFGFSSFLHSIGETETGFAKPSKPGREMVSLMKPKMAHVFTLNYLLSSSLKLRLKVTYTYSTWSILKYFDRYIGNYKRGTFLTLATSLYYFITKLGVSCRLGNGWLAVLCIRFAHWNLKPKPVSDSHNRIRPKY